MASSPSRIINAGIDGNASDIANKVARIGADGSAAMGSTTVGDWGYNGISTAATTVVKTGAGQLGAIVVLGGTLGAITVYDNTAASGTTIAPTFTPPTLAGGPATYVFNCAFTTGLTIVTATATVMTVLYR